MAKVNMKRTTQIKKDNGWTSVQDQLPNHKNSEYLGVVEVVLQCFPYKEDSLTKGNQTRQYAYLEFLGRDPNRPVWLSHGSSKIPIENSSWAVTHWRYLSAMPKPFPKPPTAKRNAVRLAPESEKPNE